MIFFLIINGQNFVYLLADPGFYPSPLNFCETSRFFPPMGWTSLTDTTDRRVSLSVRPSLRWSLTLHLELKIIFLLTQSRHFNWAVLIL